MITYTIPETKAFDGLLKTIDDLPDILARVIESAVAETSPAALSAMESAPRPSVHPFVWSYDDAAQQRARRWYFAAIARGEIKTDGTRYIRSGDYQKSWDAGIQQTQSSIDAVLGSDFDKASYVAGDETGGIKQIPGHSRTGWQDFQPVAEQWTDDMVRVVERELGVVIQERT